MSSKHFQQNNIFPKIINRFGINLTKLIASKAVWSMPIYYDIAHGRKSPSLDQCLKFAQYVSEFSDKKPNASVVYNQIVKYYGYKKLCKLQTKKQ